MKEKQEDKENQKMQKNKMGLDLEFWPFYKSLILGLEAITSKTLPAIFSPQIETLDFQNLIFIFFLN